MAVVTQDHTNTTEGVVPSTRKKERTPEQKEKQREYHRKWREVNKESQREKRKIYHIEHREQVRERCNKWRKENPEKVINQARNWRLENPEKAYELGVKWQRDNPEKVRDISTRRRARKRKAKIGSSEPIIAWEKTWRQKRAVRCYWCAGKFRGKDCHMEHIEPLAKGGAHSIENLCISCSTCNQRKGVKLLADWNKRVAEPALL